MLANDIQAAAASVADVDTDVLHFDANAAVVGGIWCEHVT